MSPFWNEFLLLYTGDEATCALIDKYGCEKRDIPDLFHHACWGNYINTYHRIVPYLTANKELCFTCADAYLTVAIQNGSFHVFKSFCELVAGVVGREKSSVHVSILLRDPQTSWDASQFSSLLEMTQLSDVFRNLFQLGCQPPIQLCNMEDDDDEFAINEHALMKYCVETVKCLPFDQHHFYLDSIKLLYHDERCADLLISSPRCFSYYLSLHLPYNPDHVIKAVCNTCDVRLLQICIDAKMEVKKEHVFYFSSLSFVGVYDIAKNRMKRWIDEHGINICDNPIVTCFSQLKKHCKCSCSEHDMAEMMFLSGLFGNVYLHAYIRSTLNGGGSWTHEQCDACVETRCQAIFCEDIDELMLAGRHVSSEMNIETYGSKTCNLFPFRSFFAKNSDVLPSWMGAVITAKMEIIAMKQLTMHVTLSTMQSDLVDYVGSFC
jgi:hypothetical protein